MTQAKLNYLGHWILLSYNGGGQINRELNLDMASVFFRVNIDMVKRCNCIMASEG
jgi:hypothetical protein